MRDEFPPSAKVRLAARVGYQCSNPSCRAFTIGPHADPSETVNVGVAAHISAASPNGPRYDPALSKGERESVENGIWLCNNCSRHVDGDVIEYTEAVLREWKRFAEEEAFMRLGKARSWLGPADRPLTDKELEVLLAAADRGEVLLLSTDQTGKWVAAGRFDFLSEADPALNAEYLEAFESLLVRRLLRHEEGNLYVFTTAGFRIARELRARATQSGTATVTGSQWVLFQPALQFTPRVSVTQLVWAGRGDVCDLEITDVSQAGFRASVKSKKTGEIEIPSWASVTFNWTAGPTD